MFSIAFGYIGPDAFFRYLLDDNFEDKKNKEKKNIDIETLELWHAQSFLKM